MQEQRVRWIDERPVLRADHLNDEVRVALTVEARACGRCSIPRAHAHEQLHHRRVERDVLAFPPLRDHLRDRQIAKQSLVA